MRWILISLLLVSCSKKPGVEEDAGTFRVIQDPSEVDAHLLGILDAEVNDAEVDAYDEEYEYQLRCWKSQSFFCTPNGLPPGDDPTLYQQEVILDICNVDGEPCTPVGLNDPDCQWQIIDMGECEDWLECDPTDPNTVVSRDVPCVGIDENGDEFTGIQDFLCQKGKILAGPCKPCETEQCNGIDDDCDGTTDEGEYPCLGDCGEGTAACVLGELVGCNAPLATTEICDGLDNDCNGSIDEDLIRPCETVCESGVEFCVDGQWLSCTARLPSEEVCDGMDNDCDGLSDEDLSCSCPPEMIGFLLPCMEEPMLCGQGFKVCECADDECSTTQMTECLAMCVWLPQPGQLCDPTAGVPIDEICNNFDDDCDVSVDEELTASCYTGPEGTVGVGACKEGELQCVSGKWGNELDGLFVEDLCLGEVTPLEEDLCTGKDDNCDGVIDKIMDETDILFIVDTSGSMSGTINAVQQSMSMFSASYSDEEVIQWGLVAGPVNWNGVEDALILESNLVPFQQFLPALSMIDDESTSEEMLYDAVYFSIRNLLPVQPLVPETFVWVPDVTSNPPVESWVINWRDDANHVVIVFSDEKGQSHGTPETTQQKIIDTATQADDLSIYTFSDILSKSGNQGWEPISVGGSWSKLTSNTSQMFSALMDIVDETACGGGGVSEASYRKDIWRGFYMAAYRQQGPINTLGTVDNYWLHAPTMQCIHPFDLKTSTKDL